MKQILQCSFSFVITLFLKISWETLPVYGHVGYPCTNYIFKYDCMGKNVYCDKNRIPYTCRCKPDYPVTIDPHRCGKPKRYNQRCSISGECTYLDEHSYCTQLPYRSTCECHDDFVYDETLNHCVKRQRGSSSSRSSMILPTAVGVALALSCILCCFLAVLHFCRRNQHRDILERAARWSPLRRSETSRHRASAPVRRVRESNLLGSGTTDTLPTYEVAVSLQPAANSEPDDEAPPCYEDVMKELEAKDRDNKPKPC